MDLVFAFCPFNENDTAIYQSLDKNLPNLNVTNVRFLKGRALQEVFMDALSYKRFGLPKYYRSKNTSLFQQHQRPSICD